jgi:hypothetical protein
MTPNQILNHKDTKNTKQTEVNPVRAPFVPWCLGGEFLCRTQEMKEIARYELPMASDREES